MDGEGPQIAVYDRLFIGGEWVEAHSGRVIASIDPSTEAVWAHVAEADAQDVDRAVAAAQAALAGPWRDFSPSKRGELLFKLAELVRRDARRLAEIESRDNGKPVKDTLGEIQRAADWLTFFAGAADKFNGQQIPFRPDALAYTRHEPVGVVAAILPWNSPISLCSWKLGPALATGNAVILKPAEQTPVSMLEIGKLVEEAGFPAGVVNVLPGYGGVTGAALSGHRGVHKVSFTGSHATAVKIMSSAAVNLKRCSFECGGKSPYIVFADAGVDPASRLAQEEVFGPLASVIPFDGEEEAIALANDTDYGLVGGLWTSDVTRAHRVAARIETGLVSVNTFRPVHYMLPYGGFKMSGVGRENGFDAMKEFTEIKTIVVELATGMPADPFAD